MRKIFTFPLFNFIAIALTNPETKLVEIQALGEKISKILT